MSCRDLIYTLADGTTSMLWLRISLVQEALD
jgi:hypothetical protein